MASSKISALERYLQPYLLFIIAFKPIRVILFLDSIQFESEFTRLQTEIDEKSSDIRIHDEAFAYNVPN